MAAPSLDAIAEEYSGQGVGSIFIYTHEAHPGENYPHHMSMEQKVRQAQDLRDILSVKRPILVDALDGACHRAYGAMPNMSWIISRSGVPVYKSDWSDSNSINNAIVYYLDVVQRRRQRQRLAPFRVERLDYRTNDSEAFFKGLERSGPKATREFIESGL
jgi:hypothetical protein